METTTQPIVRLTPRAVHKIRELAVAAGRQEPLEMRLDVIGGAASGFAYDLFFDSCNPGDRVAEVTGVRVLVRPDCLRYLAGSTVDWIEGVNGAGFQVQNPNEPEK